MDPSSPWTRHHHRYISSTSNHPFSEHAHNPSQGYLGKLHERLIWQELAFRKNAINAQVLLFNSEKNIFTQARNPLPTISKQLTTTFTSKTDVCDLKIKALVLLNTSKGAIMPKSLKCWFVCLLWVLNHFGMINSQKIVYQIYWKSLTLSNTLVSRLLRCELKKHLLLWFNNAEETNPVVLPAV